MDNIGNINWIDISEVKEHVPTSSVLVWQKNHADPECSRFQRAVIYSNFIKIYPLLDGSTYKLDDNNKWMGFDFEGDLCEITHFAFVNAPIQQ